RRASSAYLRRRFERQVRSYLADVRWPKRTGRRSTFRRELDRAVAAALLHDEADVTALELTTIERLRPQRDSFGNLEAASETWHLIRLGRAILGTERTGPIPTTRLSG